MVLGWIHQAAGPSYEHLRRELTEVHQRLAAQQRRNEQLERQLRQALSLIQQLQQDVAELQRQLHRTSSNSSLPPSANPPSAPAPVKKPPTGRKIGGQVAHPGHGRRLLPSAQVDQIVEHLPRRCARCGTRLEPVDREGQPCARQQIMELPPRAVEITEHQAFACRCPRCGTRTAAALPQELRASVCGERLSAAISLLSARVHGSRRASACGSGEASGRGTLAAGRKMALAGG